MPNTPIVVTDNTLEGQITTLARYLLTAVGGFALGKGWIDNELLQLLTGLVTVAAPTAWGIYRTWSNKAKLIEAAREPSNVALAAKK